MLAWASGVRRGPFAPEINRLLDLAQRHPSLFRVVSGVRTREEQAAIYAWGRTVVNPHTGPLEGKPLGDKATNAPAGGFSAHEARADGLGYAVDLSGPTDKLAEVVAAEGLDVVWGGSFVVDGKPDTPHFEVRGFRTRMPAASTGVVKKAGGAVVLLLAVVAAVMLGGVR